MAGIITVTAVIPGTTGTTITTGITIIMAGIITEITTITAGSRPGV
jgi:hypothetical protein